MSFQITLGQREKLKGCIALVGASGAGKTLSSLFLALGMMKEAYPQLNDEELWKKIGVIDTEHKRSLLYINTTVDEKKIGRFYHIDFQAPYSPQRYEEAIRILKQQGCEAIIVDSLTHAWEGIGGMLDIQQELGGRFQDWKTMKPIVKDFIKSLTENDVHIIGTIRTKQTYEAERNEDGKLEIKKLGLKPVQKDDIEYEFMIVFNVDQDNVARTTKDNSNMFKGKSFVIEPSLGTDIYKWLELGIDVKAEEEAKRTILIEQVKAIISSNDEAAKKVSEFEFKANKKLDEFNIKLAATALDRLKDLTTKEEK